MEVEVADCRSFSLEKQSAHAGMKNVSSELIHKWELPKIFWGNSFIHAR